MGFIDDLRATTARQKIVKAEELVNWVKKAAETIDGHMKNAALEGSDDYALSVCNITDEQKEAIKEYYKKRGFHVKENNYCTFGESKTYLDISWATEEE